MKTRRRFKQTDVLEDRLAKQAKVLRDQAEKLAPGPQREELLGKARHCEDGAHISELLRSPNPQPQFDAVPGYYAYIIGNDGHVQDRVNVICDAEEEAKRLARQLVDGHAVELWLEARKIAEFKPED
jgi:hypothetical protein